jgi:hypothetical protein
MSQHKDGKGVGDVKAIKSSEIKGPTATQVVPSGEASAKGKAEEPDKKEEESSAKDQDSVMTGLTEVFTRLGKATDGPQLDVKSEFSDDEGSIPNVSQPVRDSLCAHLHACAPYF